MLGPYCFGREAPHKVDVPNRDLLMEFCYGNAMKVANTFVEPGCSQNVTFMEAGASPLGSITENSYNVLDLLLCDDVGL